MRGYGQYCTVARAAEVLGERWTPLVVREIMCGSGRFNEIRRGVPRMSATLLTQRLRKLEEIGVIRRERGRGGWDYRLTQAGEELRPIILELGHWGARWVGSRLKREDLDAAFLMWDVRRFARVDEFPADRRVVVHFNFVDARRGERLWWLVVESGEVDLCRDDPGHELTVIVESTVRALTEIWTGDQDPDAVSRSGILRVQGAKQDVRSLWRWLGHSMFAPTRREAIARSQAAPGPAGGRSTVRSTIPQGS
jgi:DNA-binding HxlR family transcriptional regulator